MAPRKTSFRPGAVLAAIRIADPLCAASREVAPLGGLAAAHGLERGETEGGTVLRGPDLLSAHAESQAFIESWFGKLKQRCVWHEEFETLDEARAVIGAYVDGYHHRPHQGLAYRTPREVAATWKDHDDQSIPAA
jgi:hypothetical protein